LGSYLVELVIIVSHLICTVYYVMPNKQAHESAYLLVKARRIRDATLRLSHAAAGQVAMPSSVARQVPPAYLAQRVGEGEGAALPEVEMRGVQVPTCSAVEGVVREAAVGHVMEGLSAELVRELMAVVVEK
jgi:hypothetical protein